MIHPDGHRRKVTIVFLTFENASTAVRARNALDRQCMSPNSIVILSLTISPFSGFSGTILGSQKLTVSIADHTSAYDPRPVPESSSSTQHSPSRSRNGLSSGRRSISPLGSKSLSGRPLLTDDVASRTIICQVSPFPFPSLPSSLLISATENQHFTRIYLPK